MAKKQRQAREKRKGAYGIILIVLLGLSFLIFLAKSSPPQILSASVYPEKVMPGQVMIVTVQAKDTLGIKSAIAIFDNEKMPDERNIALITGTGRNGVYETRWIVHDTKAEAWYNTTIIFTNILGKKTMQEIAWQDPTVSHKASDITAGTFGAGDYVFPSSLIVNSTITTNSTIILNQLTSSPVNSTGYGRLYYVISSGDVDSYTKLLSHFDGADGATAYSDPVAGAYTFAGTAQLDTAQSKFGGTSLLLDGNSDYVTLPDSDDWNFGTGSWTVDFWLRWNTVGYQGFFTQYVSGTSDTSLFYTGNTLYMGAYTDGSWVILVTTAFTPSANTWYHLAFERKALNNNNQDIAIFIDGVIKTGADLSMDGGGAWNGAFPDRAAVLTIGYDERFSGYFNGYIDEFRVSKGIARWTSSFSVPTSAYGPSGLVFQYQNGTNKLLAGE
ncbi:MAG: LamG domain-containing protein [archaeon]